MRPNLNVLSLVTVLFCSLIATAQEGFDVQKGLTPYGSYKGGDIDSVNMMNGNLTLHIPLLSFPQRGKSLNLSYSIYNNDKQFIFSYSMVGLEVQGQWTLFPTATCGGSYCDSGGSGPGSHITNDQTFGFGTLITYASGTCVNNPQQSPCLTPVNQNYILSPDDSRHYYGNSAATCCGTYPPNCGPAVDYSGYLSTYGGCGPIIDRHGTVSGSTDVDGNYLNWGTNGTLTDTVNRSIPRPASIAVSGTPCSSGTLSANVWNVPGSSQPYYLCYKNVSYQTAFNANNLNHCVSFFGYGEASGTQLMLTEVVLPNSTRFKFNYDSYLSLTQLTLPTGGTIGYTWQNIVLNCTSKSSPMSRVLASRTTNDGTTTATWHYRWIAETDQGGTVGVTAWEHVVTDPIGSDEVHHINITGGTNGDNETDYYSGCSTINTQYCTPNGSLLKKVLMTYQSTNNMSLMGTGQFGFWLTPIPQTKTTVLAGPGPSSSWKTAKNVYTLVPTLPAKTYYQWQGDSADVPPQPVSIAMSTGQIATVDDYDFGAGSPGPKIRSTTTTYQWQNNSAYLTANLIDLPASVVVKDGSGNKCSETDYTYDEPTYLTPYSGTMVQHGSAPNGTVRGNATSISRWVSATPCQSGATGTFISTHIGMYDTGEKYQDFDAKGNPPTTYSYSSTYYGAYRTQTQLPDTGTVHHIVSGTYDLNTGLITSLTGQNGAPETTNYAWDFNMRRITSATLPDGGQTTLCYSDTGSAGGVTCSQTSLPYQVTMQTKQTQTPTQVWESKVAVFDYLGRTKQTQNTSDPQGTDYTDTTYDGKGRVATISNPHRSGPSSTDGVSTTYYDGIGRTVTIVKQDGSRVKTFYSDNCSTVNDEAGKVRKSCSDALGRLTEVDEPGAGATSGTSGSATVTIGGQQPVQTTTINPCSGNQPPAPTNCPQTIVEGGSLVITVAGFSVSTNYTNTSTGSGLAAALASQLNVSSSPVTASVSGNVITVRALDNGTVSNFSASTHTGWPSQYFAHPTFNVCLGGFSCTNGSSSGTLTGGVDPSVGNSPLVTIYTYDALGNLLAVNQKGNDPNSANWRTRTLTYDSLSRLITANNPETGTVCYGGWSGSQCINGYDNNGNLLKKTDARNVTVAYAYDALNRLTTKSYPNASPFNDATITYTYDAFVSGSNYGIGLRTGMTDASGSSSWTYDLMGRVWSETHIISGVTKTISNLYNLDGSIQQVTYPAGSGSLVKYSYDAAPHLTQVQDTAHSIVYFASNAYFPPGQLNQATYGTITETGIFNSRLQPCWMFATTSTILSASTPCSGSPTQAATLMDMKYGFNLGSGDNGNVLSVTNGLDSNRSVTYTYDALNRIASATTANTDCSLVTGTSIPKNWGETFAIDAWGNLTGRTVTKCSADSLSVVALASNRLSGFGYDAAGNMTSNGGASYTYNAESQLKTAGGVTYTYDGEGNRVKKSSGTEYWGAGPLLESDASGNLQREYVFAGGRRIGRRDIGQIYAHFFLSDDLNSTHMVINGSTNAVENDSDYLPYGYERVYKQTLPSQNFKFDGKERDGESQLDEFGARYYAYSLGRFMIPDWASKPIAVPYANFGNPQSLNLFSYVQNNPTTTGDVDGHGEIYSPAGKNLGSDGLNDGWVYIANSVTKAADGTVNMADTFTTFSISPQEGAAIWDSYDRTISPSTGDLKGGFHEAGFTETTRGGINVAPNGPGFTSTQEEAHINLTVTSDTVMVEHTHPPGTTDSNVYGGTHFNQDPSTSKDPKHPADIQLAGRDSEIAPQAVHVELGVGDKTVRVYDRTGVRARVPLDAFHRRNQTSIRHSQCTQAPERNEPTH